jgi:hypothetical protein
MRLKNGILKYAVTAICKATMYHIVLPWGKYKYCWLLMGLLVSPDIFQEKMSELMAGLDFARAYLDDLLIISTEKGKQTSRKVGKSANTPVRSRSKNQCGKKLLWKNKPTISWL